MDRQSGTFEPYLNFNVRTFAIGAGLTYELISGNYDKISYSNLRGIRLDLSMVIRPIQRNHINWLCRPASAAWLEAGVLTTPALMPYARLLSPSSYAWIPPGMESPDPLKEVKANADELELAITSRHELCARRGRVFEEVVNELAAEEQAIREAGLSIGQVDAALKNNPAALMGEDEEE